MADINLTPDWQAVAEGEGAATFEALNQNVRWFVATSTPSTAGFSAPANKTVSMSLAAGETLYLRGVGTAVVLADNVPD